MSTESGSSRKRPLRLRVHSAIRWIHTYLSMLTFLVVLFFSATGITLNHPEWTFGTRESKRDLTGSVNKAWVSGKVPDWLAIAEALRQRHGVHGTVADRHEDDREVSLSFKAPGYSADCFVERETGAYQLSVVSSGWLASLNDFHRGRDAGRAWSWTLDLSGAFLIVISLTGIGMVFYLKKVRLKSLITAAVGCVLVILLIKLAS